MQLVHEGHVSEHWYKSVTGSHRLRRGTYFDFPLLANIAPQSAFRVSSSLPQSEAVGCDMLARLGVSVGQR